MIKKIILLGSTGSIGKSTINVLKKNKPKFKIVLLSTNSNIDVILKQSKEFNVKNILKNEKIKFKKYKNKFIKKKLN